MLKWIVSAIRMYHRIEDTRLDQIVTISMTGIPKNESNKIRKEMERDNNEVSQDDVEPVVSLCTTGEGCLAKWTKQRKHATNESRE